MSDWNKPDTDGPAAMRVVTAPNLRMVGQCCATCVHATGWCEGEGTCDHHYQRMPGMKSWPMAICREYVCDDYKRRIQP